jgi:integrase
MGYTYLMPTFRATLNYHLAKRRSAPTVYVENAPADHVLSAPVSGKAEDRKVVVIDPQPPDRDPIATYLDASQAPATRAAYQSDWADFTSWCAAQDLIALPATPATVARYLITLAQAGRTVATLTRRLAAISVAHQAADLPTPAKSLLVRKVLAGIRRLHGTPQIGKAPLSLDELRQLLEQLDVASLAGLRDRALLLLGFAGAFRRSELVNLNVGDLQQHQAGLIITLRRSKTDQLGEGQRKGIPYGQQVATCPVRAVEAWRAAAQIRSGPLFRPIDRYGRVQPQRLAPYHVTRLIKRLCVAAGLDATRYAGHSLRAGLATAAAAAGVDERTIMAQTGHKSEKMVRRYIRDGELFRKNAAGDVGL